MHVRGRRPRPKLRAVELPDPAVLRPPATLPSPYASRGAVKSPRISSPYTLVKNLVTLADIKPDDVFLDLGCGSGVAVVGVSSAVKCMSLGIEVNQKCCKATMDRATATGVTDDVHLYNVDMMSPVGWKLVETATVIYAYLPTAMEQAHPLLMHALLNGCRLVTFMEHPKTMRHKAEDLAGMLRLYTKANMVAGFKTSSPTPTTVPRCLSRTRVESSSVSPTESSLGDTGSTWLTSSTQGEQSCRVSPAVDSHPSSTSRSGSEGASSCDENPCLIDDVPLPDLVGDGVPVFRGESPTMGDSSAPPGGVTPNPGPVSHVRRPSAFDVVRSR